MLNPTSRWLCGLLVSALALQGPASIALAAPAPQQAKSGGGATPHSQTPTVESYQKLYAGIFVELFGQPYDSKHWSYRLATHVKGEGFFAGKNQYGQDFKFEALIANPIDLPTLANLTASQLATLQSQQLQYTSAQGWIHGPFASVPVDIVVITQSSSGTPETNFMITARLPDDHPLLHLNDIVPLEELPPPPPAVYRLNDPDPTPQVDPDFAHYLDLQTPQETQLAAIDATFQALFGASPQENHYGLPFEKNVSAPGNYEGKPAALELSDPDAALKFSFAVDAATPIDLKTMPQVSAAYAQMAVDNGITHHRVSGWLSSEAGATYVDALAIAQNGGPSAVFSLAVMQEPGPSPIVLELICFPLIIPIPYWCLDQDCVDACKAARDAAIDAAKAAFDAAKDAARSAYDSAVYAAGIARDVAKTAAKVAYGVALKACAASQASQLLACALIAGIFLSWFTGGLSLVACLAQVAIVFAACAAVASGILAAALVGIDAIYESYVASARAAYDAAIAAAASARDSAIQAALDAYDACVAACWYICWKFIIIWLCW